MHADGCMATLCSVKKSVKTARFHVLGSDPVEDWPDGQACLPELYTSPMCDASSRWT